MPVPVRPLLRRLKAALPFLPGTLPVGLTVLEIVLVDRATMARVHGDFLGDPTETDVITFPYGEILVCPAVARDQATARGLEVDDEILLYGLHGILHLCGFDDTTAPAARRMAAAQSRLMKDVQGAV